MNKISLDSIGLAGFGHDFHALDGTRSEVQKVFDSFAHAPESGRLNAVFALLAAVLPGGIFMRMPSERLRLFKSLSARMREVSEELWRKSQAEKEAVVGMGGGGNEKVRSALETLCESTCMNFNIFGKDLMSA